LSRISGKNIDPSIFAFAPKLHTGLRADEYPAILQKGEEVRSVEQVKRGADIPNINVQIINKGQPVEEKETTQDFDGKDYILSVVVDGVSTNHGGIGDFFKNLGS
ncbi:MAG: hypothetical protein PVI54_19575, partial [Desulfobacteraceae bacterium]